MALDLIKLSHQFNKIAKTAIEHDLECKDSGGYCAANRWHTVALLMHALDLDLTDLGYIAESWLDLSVIDDPTTNDSILDAKVIHE